MSPLFYQDLRQISATSQNHATIHLAYIFPIILKIFEA